MNQHKYYFLLLAATLLQVAACTKDVAVKVPPYTPQLYIVSTPALGDYITAQIGQTASLATVYRGAIFEVHAASVSLYVGGVYSTDMHWDTSANAYISPVVAEAGKQYQIKVVAPSFATAEAVTNAPSFVPIDSIAHIANARTTENGGMQDAIIITFTDPPAAGDLYIVKIGIKFDTTIGYGSTAYCVSSSDPDIETIDNELAEISTCLSNNGIFVRDGHFNGQQKQLKIYTSPFNLSLSINGDTLNSYIELMHVSADYFQYLKSNLIADNANGDPFSEPTNVYTNVKNGYGIFSIVSSSSRDLP